MKINKAALILTFAATLSACNEMSSQLANNGKGWYVYKNGAIIQWIDDKPGPRVSRALLPPKTPIQTHPFMTLTSNDINSEGELSVILDKSNNFKEYVENLKRSGYEVKPKKGDEVE